jgi:hypothetical protein
MLKFQDQVIFLKPDQLPQLVSLHVPNDAILFNNWYICLQEFQFPGSKVYLESSTMELDLLMPPYKVTIQDATKRAVIELDSIVLILDAIRRLNRQVYW